MTEAELVAIDMAYLALKNSGGLQARSERIALELQVKHEDPEQNNWAYDGNLEGMVINNGN